MERLIADIQSAGERLAIEGVEGRRKGKRGAFEQGFSLHADAHVHENDGAGLAPVIELEIDVATSAGPQGLMDQLRRSTMKTGDAVK